MAVQRGLTPLAMQIAERWQSAQQPLSIQRIAAEFQDASRYDIVAALRTLEKAGHGTFTPAHGSEKPKFTWHQVNKAEPRHDANAKRRARAPTAEAARAATGKPSAAARSNAAGTKRAEASKSSQTQDNQSVTQTSIETPAASTSSVLDHHFHLRSGFVVKLTLPTDLTRAEAERLAKFLQAIPFASDASE